MSDMSFKQARELTERFELAELSLKTTLDNINNATNNFNNTLIKQQQVMQHIPKTDDKLNLLKIIVALNIGFIIGLMTAKYIF